MEPKRITPNSLKPTSLAEEWEVYLAKVYPEGTGKEQLKQLEQAFLVGALCTHTYLHAVTASEEDSDKAANMLEAHQKGITIRSGAILQERISGN